MKTTFLKSLTGVTATMMLASLAGAQVANNEVEPNENKANATVANSGGPGMVAGDFITGTTTGTSTTASAATSRDTFRVKTAALPAAIYLHQLTVTGTPWAQTIQGLLQTASGITAGSDATFQTAATISGTEVAKWYGFGKQEEIYYRVTGTTSTTTQYTATLSTTAVTPIDIPGTIVDGSITIARIAGNSTDVDFWVYNSNFDPIANYGGESPDQITRTFAPGTYYIAMTNWNGANNQGNPTTETFLTSNVMDFPNVWCNSSSTTALNLGIQVTSPAGTVSQPATKTAAFETIWYRMVVTPNVNPTNPTGTGSRAPLGNVDLNDTVQFNVLVTPGANPTSSGVVVTADLTAAGNGIVSLFDDGAHGDGAAGDNNFGAAVTLSTAGTYTVPFAISDAQSRSGSGSFGSITVRSTTAPACPIGLEPQSFTGMNSTGPVGNSGNSVRTFTFTSGDPVLNLHISGRCSAASTATYRSEARWRITPPGGSPILVQSNTVTGGGWDFFDVADKVVPIPGNIPANAGTWTIETYEDFDDSGLDATWKLCITVEPNNLPTPPVVAGVNASALAGSAVLLSANVTPGANPTSTSITVTGDLSGIGGSATQAFFDDGTNGDVTAGDNVYSVLYAVPSGTVAGAYSLALTATDNLSRTGSGSLTLNVDDAGQTLASAATFTGDTINGSIGFGNDVDMYRVFICDPATFTATVTATGGAMDSQLFLFRADGTGAAFNDDQASVNRSQITGAVAQALPAGEYYLAITDYNTDPHDSANNLIWANSPFTGTRAPDGPGAANPLATWDTGGGDTGTYTIVVTGANGTGCAPATGSCCMGQYCQVLTQTECNDLFGVWGGAGTDCSNGPCASSCGWPDFNHDGDVGTDQDIESFFACLGGNCCATCDSPDFNGDGDVGTDQDIEAFFRVLGGGNC